MNIFANDIWKKNMYLLDPSQLASFTYFHSFLGVKNFHIILLEIETLTINHSIFRPLLSLAIDTVQIYFAETTKHFKITSSSLHTPLSPPVFLVNFSLLQYYHSAE